MVLDPEAQRLDCEGDLLAIGFVERTTRMARAGGTFE
jgi:hypothetical protein